MKEKTIMMAPVSSGMTLGKFRMKEEFSMHKKTTININKNGFKPFLLESHFVLYIYYRLTYNDFEVEKRLKKDVKYAAEAI